MFSIGVRWGGKCGKCGNFLPVLYMNFKKQQDFEKIRKNLKIAKWSKINEKCIKLKNETKPKKQAVRVLEGIAKFPQISPLFSFSACFGLCLYTPKVVLEYQKI